MQHFQVPGANKKGKPESVSALASCVTVTAVVDLCEDQGTALPSSKTGNSGDWSESGGGLGGV